MKRFHSVSVSLALMACIGMVLPQAVLAETTTATRRAANVLNVSLADDGLLIGQVVNPQGKEKSGVEVILSKQGKELARAKTDAKGRFAMKGLSGGEYALATTSGKIPVRAWSKSKAPRAAAIGALLVDGVTVRGQSCHCNGASGAHSYGGASTFSGGNVGYSTGYSSGGYSTGYGGGYSSGGVQSYSNPSGGYVDYGTSTGSTSGGQVVDYGSSTNGTVVDNGGAVGTGYDQAGQVMSSSVDPGTYSSGVGAPADTVVGTSQGYSTGGTVVGDPGVSYSSGGYTTGGYTTGGYTPATTSGGYTTGGYTTGGYTSGGYTSAGATGGAYYPAAYSAGVAGASSGGGGLLGLGLLGGGGAGAIGAAPLLIGAGVAAAIAVPIAIDDDDDAS